MVQVASAGAYRVGTGALKALTLGNNLTETQTYDGKNAPAAITVSSNRLAWAYTTDDEGNPTAITQTQPAAESRTYGYQDFAYFLASADGPWGTLAWNYDKIGNRLSELRNGLAPGDVYSYLPNAATPTPGNTATLDRIDLAVGGTKDYTFGPAGHLDRIEESAGATLYAHTAEGQLGTITRGAEQPVMAYDGRSFLREATTADSTIFADGFETGNLDCWSTGGPGCFAPMAGAVTTATYGSEGLLYSIEKKSSPTASATRFHLFYFAGRPVAEVEIPPTGAPTWTYLTTDHLGTPILATASAGAERWRGGFEPFGTDWRAGTPAGASENGVFLRLPGQWVDGVWGEGETHNVWRWYQAATGLYSNTDRLGLRGGSFGRLNELFVYARGNPIRWVDPLGLIATEGCQPGEVASIEGAISDVKKQLEPRRRKKDCTLCEADYKAIVKHLDSATYFCTSKGDRYERVHELQTGCGSVRNRKGHEDQRSIALRFPEALVDFQCGCLAKTIFHEATHNVMDTQDYTESNNAYHWAGWCISCE